MTGKSSQNLHDVYGYISENLKAIEERITKAAQAAGRTREDICFLAATKTVDAKRINYAISSGLKYIGENRVQELLEKYEEYDLENAQLHFIGHLQTNKVKYIIDKVSMIESVHSIKLAEEIGKQASKRGIVMDVLLEVNIGNEENKSGFSKSEINEVLEKISRISGIKVCGLMAIPPICENKVELERYFSQMNEMFIDNKQKKLDNISMNHLSMGMSNDFEIAIKYGANIIRVGSLLFGKRNYT